MISIKTKGDLSPKIWLPRLAFGEESSQVDYHFDHYTQKISRVLKGLQAFDPIIGSNVEFASKSAVLDLGVIKLAANANTSVHVSVSDSDEIHLLMSLIGVNHSIVEKKRFIWGRGKQSFAILLPATARSGKSEIRSNVSISLNKDHIEHTAQIMLKEDYPVDLKLNTPRVLEMKHGSIDFFQQFSALFAQIEALQLNVFLLKQLAFEDVITRQVVMLLRPDLFFSTSLQSEHLNVSEAIIQELCDYIHAHLTDTISLTLLEKISGLSARRLQLGFKRYLGVSPMLYVRQSRLEAAKALIASGSGMSIAEIAYLFKFASQSYFCRYYVQSFGITPKEDRPHNIIGTK